MIPTNKTNLNISVIKFSVQKKKYNRRLYKPQKETECSQISEQRQRSSSNIHRSSSLIPTTYIKIKMKKQKEKVETSINPLSSSQYNYSKFPYRKPKSKRIAQTTYIPVSKERLSISFICEHARSKTIDQRQRYRARVTSCFDLKPHEDEKKDFVRYSHHQLKTQYIERRRHTFDKFGQSQ